MLSGKKLLSPDCGPGGFVRFGLITDTHLHNWQTFGQCHDGQISKRLLQQRDNFLQAISYFKKQKVDAIIHGGDWVHIVGVVSNEVLNISKEILYNIDLPLEIVVGNHDTPVRILPKQHHIITNLLNDLRIKPLDRKSLTCKLLTVNYYDEVDYEAIKGYDLVVLHKTPIGCKIGGRTFNNGVNWKKLADQNKFVAFGDIHQMQKLSNNCFVIGTPMKLGFGEYGDRGVWIVDTDAVTCKFHKLDYPEFIEVDDPDKIKDDGNYYKVIGTKQKIDNENVVSVVVPEVFTERIKSQDFAGILKEWININDKKEGYLEIIDDIIGEKLSLVKNLYKGRLKKVTIKDFLSVGEVTYDVPEIGFILVEGISDTFSSNGGGKTSIVGEAVCWGLFGETTKGLTGDSVVRNRPTQQKDCIVSLVLEEGGKDICVTRSRKNGLVVEEMDTAVEMTRGMRSEDKQKVLEGVLGFNKSLFMTSMYFSQKTPLMLARMSDTEKTNMITDLLGFEEYDDLQEKVQKKIKSIEIETAKEELKNGEFSRDLIVVGDRLSNTVKMIEDTNKKSTDLWDTIKSYKVKIEELKSTVIGEQNFEHIDYAVQISEVADAQERFLDKVAAVRESIDATQADYTRISNAISTHNANVLSWRNNRIRVQSDLNDLKERMAKIGTPCPTCGSTITGNNSDDFEDPLKSRLAEIDDGIGQEELLSDIRKKELNIVVEERNKLKEKEAKFNFEHAKLKPRILELQRLNNDQAEKEKELLLLEQRHKSEIDKYNTLIVDTKKRIASIDDELFKLDASKSHHEKEIEGIEEKRTVILEHIRQCYENTQKLEFWNIAFSSKGIRSVLLDRFCNEINATINGYLSMVSGGSMSIMMTPTKTTKGGEERNKIGMSIQINGNDSVYEALSGGEERRVDVSLCFGLNKFVADKYQVPNGVLGFVIMDECFTNLDDSGAESVAELLSDAGKKRVVFVIEHNAILSSYADKKWVVKKDKDISSLEVGV